jgi:SAM-dependent methyltransferase
MGRYTLLLAERGIRVEGLDLTPVLLDRLRAYNAGRFDIPLHCADVCQPPPGLEGRFDAVLATFALHHMHDIPACVAAMARLARPGGRLVFLEPNPYNMLYYVQIALAPGVTWDGDRGILNMRRTVIFGALRGAGLRELAMARFGFFPPFLANRRWGRRVEAVLERIPVWRGLLPFQLFRGSRP